MRLLFLACFLAVSTVSSAANVSAFRVTITDAPSSITVPNLGNPNTKKKVYIRNVGSGLFANPFRFNFPGDASNQYIELAASSAYPFPIGGLFGGELITTDGVNGSGTAEILIYEE